MKTDFKITKPLIRVTSFLLLLWLTGLLLSIWFGLGWFFFLESIRRIIIAIPQTYIPFLRLVVSTERANEEESILEKKSARWLYVWRGAVACIWLILTVVVFKFVNIRLIDIFS